MEGIIPHDKLLDLGRRAVISRAAFLKFSAYLRRLSDTQQVPYGRPIPSNQPKDSLSVVFSALGALNHSCGFGLMRQSRVAQAMDVTKLLTGLAPFITSWTTYIVDEIITPGREDEFYQHDFSTTIAALLAYLLNWEEIHEAYASVKQYHHGATRFFVSNAALSIFHRLASRPPLIKSQRTILVSCFSMIASLFSYKRDTAWCQDILKQLKEEHETFVSTFQLLTIPMISDLETLTAVTDVKNCVYAMDRTYLAMFHVISQRTIMDLLMEREHMRWTCEFVVKFMRSKLLRHMEPGTSVMDVVDGIGTPFAAVAVTCLATISYHLKQIIHCFGHHNVKYIYDSKAMTSMFSFFRFIPGNDSGPLRQRHMEMLSSLIDLSTPYLTYYSTFRSARREHNRLQQCLPNLNVHPSAQKSKLASSWQSYQQRMEQMEQIREIFKGTPSTICDHLDCPNLRTTAFSLKTCSGCGMYFYCSHACQKADWPRHRDEIGCASIRATLKSSMSRFRSSLDLYMFDFILRETLRPLSTSLQTSLMIYMDFTLPVPKTKLVQVRDYSHVDGFSEMMRNIKLGHGKPVCRILPAGYQPEEACLCYPFGPLHTGGIAYSPAVAQGQAPKYETSWNQELGKMMHETAMRFAIGGEPQ